MNQKQSHKRIKGEILETNSEVVRLCQGPYMESYPVLSIYQLVVVVLHICGRSQML